MSEKAGSTDFTFFKRGGKGMLFLFCVLLASGIWVVNALGKTYTTEFSYSLTAPVASGKDDVPVIVTLRGQGFMLMQIYFRINDNKYPFSTFSNSVNCIEFTDSLMGDLRNEVTLTEVKPAIITGSVNTGQKMKKLPVKSRVELQYAPMYSNAVPVLLKPDSVEIAGPAAILDTLHYIYTEKITESNLDKPLFRSIGLQVPHSSCWLKNDRIWLYVAVEEFTEATIQVPISIEDQKERIQLIPEKVAVKCLVPLSRYNDISASQFTVEITRGEPLTHEKVTLSVTRRPAFVKQIRTEPHFVSILIFDK
ncbi:MAG: hypothetical protein ABI772_01790 [Bacteroidota bacterium]